MKNLDGRREAFERLDYQVFQLFNDAEQHRHFVLPNGPPEDELVSTCIIILDLSCCVFVCLEVS